MNRARIFVGRHGSCLVALFTVTFVVHVALVDTHVAAEGQFPVQEIHPLMTGLVALAQSIPGMSGFGGMRLLTILGVAAMAGFLHLGVYRITGRRVVSMAAGLLAAIHPAVLAVAAQPGGIQDVTCSCLVAWAFCLHARPRFRSSRFPNQMPSPYSRWVLGIMVLAALSGPHAWLIPVLLILLDLSFDRERGGEWNRRNWRGYIPYGMVSVACVVTALFHGGASRLETSPLDGPGVFDSASPVMLAVSPRFAEVMPGILEFVVWTLLLLGIGVFILDQLSGIGLRHRMVQYFGFSTAWLLVAVLPSDLLGEFSVGGNITTGIIGCAVFGSALLWRLTCLMVPAEVPAAVAVSPVRVDPPSQVASPASGDRVLGGQIVDRDTFSPELEVALERLGMIIAQEGSDVLSPVGSACWDRFIAPHAASAGHVVELSSAGTSCTTRLVPLAERVTVLLGDSTGDSRIEKDLAGVTGVNVMPVSGGDALPLDDNDVDLLLVADWGGVDLEMAESARVLGTDGVLIQLFGSDEEASAAAAAVEKHGLQVSDMGSSAGGDQWCLVAARNPGGGSK